MPTLTDYTRTVALVTGASSGIGAALARDLAARGARVALLARREERLRAVAEEITRRGGEALTVPCDVGDRAGVERAIATVTARLGDVDVLVNAAGEGAHRLFEDETIADVERLVRTHYLGTVYLVKAVLPRMRARRQGWIVNVSSVAGRLGQPDEAAYSAAKFAVTGLSEALTYELTPLGIHVLVVYPGLVRTAMLTPEVAARLPPRLVAGALEPGEVSRRVLRALARGRHELTVPGGIGFAYVLRAVLPGLLRWATGRVRLPVLPELRR